MIEINGYIDHIIYKNQDNGYSVLVFVCDDDEDITATGSLVDVSEGEHLTIRGDFIEHQVYGRQFSIESYEVSTPESEDAIRRYLGSGAIKGVGPALSKRIVKEFGKDTFRIIEREPERLSLIKGISERMAMEISEQIIEKEELRSALIFLMKYGISNQLAVKIYKKYGSNLYSIIEENPYRLSSEIKGVGFKKADEIASNAGIKKDSPHRIASGIIYVLNLAAMEGHTYLPEDELCKRAVSMLEVDKELIKHSLMSLSIDRRIVIRAERVYGYLYYHREEECARILLDLDASVDSQDNVNDVLSGFSDDLELDDIQMSAVYAAITQGVTIITGGPGTGKTTTIKAIINYFAKNGKVTELAAPTGRAAKRMSEATGFFARTIHRLLEAGGKTDDEDDDDTISRFGRDRDYPIEADVIIIDEASMVDLSLMYYLLKAIPMGTRLILVGDINQLPSVGAGNVLRDIIDCKKFSVITLEKIFRQARNSDIVVNAHKIQNDEMVILDNKSDDFFFLKRKGADQVISTILPLLKTKIPKYVNADTYDIQVLTPTRKGLIGVERLNTILQKELNPPSYNKREHVFGNMTLREGDKVMQIKNNYKLTWETRNGLGFVIEEGSGIFNGDMGIVRDIEEFKNTVRVEFDEGRMVEYDFKQVDELELAYAITVHKSQGSEYPAVIIPLLSGPTMLMNRNLIYTAITRAKSCVILVGDEKVFYEMVSNKTQLMRYSSLKACIESYSSESV